MDDDAIVGWRYRRPGFLWTLQKNRPLPKPNYSEPEIEPVYSAAEIIRLRAALDAAETLAKEATLTALAAQGQAAEAHEAPLTPADAMRCPEFRALYDAVFAQMVGPIGMHRDVHTAMRAINAAIAPFTKGSDG